MKKKETGVAVKVKNEVAIDEAALAELRELYPTEATFNRIILPRLGLISQDQTEGKGKSMKVVAEAGTFYTERESEEAGADGKKTWEKEEIGTEIEGIILYRRYQLSEYDEDTELYTSSPVYDKDDEILPLFCDKKEVDRGTPAELQAKRMYTNKKGKEVSSLEVNRILYVLYEGEIFQMNLRGTSMYAFMTYARKVTPPAVLTKFCSEPKEKGDIEWNQMTFEAVRQVNKKELAEVLEKVRDINAGVIAEKGFYSNKNKDTDDSNKKAEETFNKVF